jgi:hypothetical protein
MPHATSSDPVTAGGGCPICGKATDHAFRPFCSRRCADIDLARWLGGRYVISTSLPDAGAGRGEEGEAELGPDAPTRRYD